MNLRTLIFTLLDSKDFPLIFVPFAFIRLNFTPWTLMREATLIYAHEIQAKDAHCNCTRASPSSSSSSSSQQAQKQPQDVEYDPPCPQILTQITVTVPKRWLLSTIAKEGSAQLGIK